MPRIRLLRESSATPPTLQVLNRSRNGAIQDIDRLLLHSEPVTNGWHALFQTLARDCTIDLRLRELALLRIGFLNRARYQLFQHRRIALTAGIDAAEIEDLQNWRASERFSSREQAVLAYVDAMTLNVQVSDPVFDALRPHFSERQLVELTATIAGYNMVSRFMEALELTPE